MINTVCKYFTLTAILILIVGSVIGVAKYQESVIKIFGNDKFLENTVFVIVLYAVSIIVGLKAINNKGWPLMILIFFFAIQIPVIISDPLQYEFNTGISYNILFSEEQGISQYWYFGSKSVFIFSSSSFVNVYGINIIGLLYFIGLLYIYLKRPIEKVCMDNVYQFMKKKSIT